MDWTVTGHFGHKTLWDTSAPISTIKTLRHQTRGTRQFGTSAVIDEKPGHFDPGQFRWDTAPPVIRLKLRHKFCGAEVSRCRSVRLPIEQRQRCTADTAKQWTNYFEQSLMNRLWANIATNRVPSRKILIHSHCHIGVRDGGGGRRPPFLLPPPIKSWKYFFLAIIM